MCLMQIQHEEELPLIVQLQMHMGIGHLLSSGFYGAIGIDFRAFCRKPAQECMCTTHAFGHACTYSCVHTYTSHTYAHTHSQISSTKEEITLAAHGKIPTTNTNWDLYNQVEPCKLSHMCSCRGQRAECKQPGILYKPSEVYNRFRNSKIIEIIEM